MTVQSNKLGGTAANDASHGVAAWTAPENALLDDGDATSALVAGPNISQYLKVTNFGFTLPTNASEFNTLCFVRRNMSAGGSVDDDRLRLVKAGVVQDSLLDLANVGEVWPTSIETKQYGNRRVRWGKELIWSDFNNAGFGIVYAVDCLNARSLARVYFVKLSIWFTHPQSGERCNQERCLKVAGHP